VEKIFKAKRLDTGEWVEFGLFDYCCQENDVWVASLCEHVQIDDKTVSQYTGINDSEGNRIFEGDYFDCDGICSFKDGAFRYVTEKNDKSLTAGCLNLKLKLTGRNIHDRG